MNEPSSTPITVSPSCPHCATPIDSQDNYCRRCGRSLKTGYSFCYSHSGILLFALVLGPFVLPWVWLSKRMGLTAKIIYSLVCVLIGYYLIVSCYHLFQLTQQSVNLLLGGF